MDQLVIMFNHNIYGSTEINIFKEIKFPKTFFICYLCLVFLLSYHIQISLITFLLLLLIFADIVPRNREANKYFNKKSKIKSAKSFAPCRHH